MAENNYVQAGMMGATREQLEAWTSTFDMGEHAYTEKMDDLTVAEKVHKFFFTCSEEQWDAMDPECGEWVNSVTYKLADIKKKADAIAKAKKPAAKKPAAKKPAAKAPAKAAPKAAPPVEEEKEMSADEIINGCKTKKEIVESAAALGSSLKIVMSWTVAKMKKEVLADLAKAEEQEAAPEKKAAPARVPADPNAEEPTKAQVEKAKAGAAATAETEKKKKVTQAKIEGEPFRQNTTAYLVWDTVRQAEKELTVAEIKERYMEAFNAQDVVTSSNPEGRVTAVMSHMRQDSMVLPGKGAGTWVFNPEYVAP